MTGDAKMKLPCRKIGSSHDKRRGPKVHQCTANCGTGDREARGIGVLATRTLIRRNLRGAERKKIVDGDL